MINIPECILKLSSIQRASSEEGFSSSLCFVFSVIPIHGFLQNSYLYQVRLIRGIGFTQS